MREAFGGDRWASRRLDPARVRDRRVVGGWHDGETLKKRIEQGPLPIDEALNITMQIAQGLAKAHEEGIVHRDIKPANLMLTKDGFVKIVDFGIAKLLGVTGPTQPGSTLGTVSYMSPEQVEGENADQQSDVWARRRSTNVMCCSTTGVTACLRTNESASPSTFLTGTWGRSTSRPCRLGNRHIVPPKLPHRS